MLYHGPSPVSWKSMAYSFVYFFWALDQAQSANYSFFSFATFHFLHLNNSAWRREEKKIRKKFKSPQNLSMKQVFLNQGKK